MKLGFWKKNEEEKITSDSANLDIAEFEKYSKRYGELVRNKEFSRESINELHNLQKNMLEMLLSN